MVIHIQSGANNIQTNSLPASVQSVPLKIYADCDARVSKHFDSCVKKSHQDADGDILTSAFRGYPLQGRKIELPKNYTGLVFHEGVTPDTDNDDRKFYVIHTFNSITYWRWSKQPSRNDAIVQAMDWIDVAEALHSPITED